MGKRLLKAGLLLLLVIFLLGLFLFAIIEPQTKLGYYVFRIFYSNPISRSTILRSYSKILKETNGGYIPQDVDQFLCKELETASGRKVDAILDFYISQ